ncbi:MAG: TonB family protein [candidate division KSB1 bacterium]|nr:TonB family protein [candidate division KSB1 bacterium]MDZ7274544.1 TonB family protein [candidate division KSB1 bacterium]MDZ7284795.1 TonB family protein [candidate division KSB1 bacterium]MDZ7297785.1 TonB family protein [candidate division KSB1 bacterium]MDZ7306426.1 TonB family protein [candidate division KSB1 bacterium]
MAGTQHLKLRIERNGEVRERHLRQKEALSIGRSPDNDIVLYGEHFPKKMQMFVPNGNGYELRLLEGCRGEVVQDNKRLDFTDLLSHGLLPKRDGYPCIALSPGKFGFVHLGDVRIDFAFDSTPVETLDFAGFSPMQAFLKNLQEDGLFRSVLTALLMTSAGVSYWLSTIPFAPPRQEVVVEQVVRRISKFIPKVQEPPPPPPPLAQTSTAGADANNPKNEKKEGAQEGSTKEREGKGNAGYGEKTENPGQGVNLENMAALALLTGSGSSDQGSGVLQQLLDDDLATSLTSVVTNTKLTAGGRGKSGQGQAADPNDILAASLIGEGEGGGGAKIDEILAGDIGSQKKVSLEKAARVRVETMSKTGGSQEAMGARSEESLRAVLMKNMGRLQYIYNKYLKLNPDIGGKVQVEITINADGTVAKAVVLSSEIAIPEFQNEIVDAIKRWKYDAIASGAMTVVCPIVFYKV